jgi:hypothetical protein
MDPADKTQQAPESVAERVESVDMESEVADLYDQLDAADNEEAEIEETETTAEASEEEETAPEETAEAEIAEEIETQQEEAAEAEESGYTEPAPERWPAEMKEVYAKLPPEGRKMMMEQVYKPMQAQYTKSTQEMAEIRKAVDPMLEALNNYRNDFERMGVNPAEAFRTQIAWAAHFARVGPQQGIADMQAAYGQNVVPAGQQEEEYLTPVERAMKTEIGELKQQLNQTSQGQKQYLEQQAQQQQQAQYNEVQRGLQSFINEQKDGKPVHPHVERVAPAIAGLIRGGLINSRDQHGQPIPIRDQMAQAYNMAVSMDPSLSKASGSGGQAGRAIAAQKVGVVANTPAGKADVEGMTVSEQLDAENDRLSRRVG